MLGFHQEEWRSPGENIGRTAFLHVITWLLPFPPPPFTRRDKVYSKKILSLHKSVITAAYPCVETVRGYFRRVGEDAEKTDVTFCNMDFHGFDSQFAPCMYAHRIYYTGPNSRGHMGYPTVQIICAQVRCLSIYHNRI
jgi:hypothetical protein